MPPSTKNDTIALNNDESSSTSAAAAKDTFTHHSQEQDDATTPTPSPQLVQLLQLLSTEIHRDGGASLVTSLKDYLPCSVKKFDALIRNCSCQQQYQPQKGNGKAKLLVFLEEHPPIFKVDRSATPHWVTLLSNDYVDYKDHTTTTTTISKEGEKGSSNNPTKPRRRLLLERAVYVMRKRQAKLERRQEKYATTITTTTSKMHGGSDNHHDDSVIYSHVNSHWLVKQCQWEVHAYLRSIGYYSQIYSSPSEVQPVGSRKWQDLVTCKFEEALQQQPQAMEDDDDSSLLSLSRLLKVDHGKIWLVGKKLIDQEDCRGIDTDTTTKKNSTEFDDDDDDYWNQVQDLVTRLVEDDGGHQVSLDLLLHRHDELKRLLGGRDFWKLYNQHYDSDNTSNELLMVSLDDTQIILKSTTPKKTGRMQIQDEEGLFSVTNSKWGSAIGNILIQACHKVQALNTNNNNNQEMTTTTTSDTSATSNNNHIKSLPLLPKLTAIDLTASIGGMTLGLAKTKKNAFDKIIAMELDPGRAKLCQENMQQHGVDNIVQVWNEDSVQALPKVASLLDLQNTASLPPCLVVVIDPPWGGYRYKQKGMAAIQMGPWSLAQVVEQIAIHLCTTASISVVTGMRLPLTFELDAFMATLKEEPYALNVSILDIRKLGVQLFVVLHVQGKQDGSR